MTLADIVVFNSLLSPFTFAFDAGFRKAMPHVSAWFESMSRLPFIAGIAGIVKPMGTGQSQVSASTAKSGLKQEKTKKEATKPKAAPKAAKKEEDDAEFDPFAEEDEED